jgi:hypothetical protein
MPTVYKIHPAIGVARIGTSDDFYIAPETPGGLPTDPGTGLPVTSFRDANGNLRKQAARFRVFAYDSVNPSDPGTEVTAGADGVASIAWTVYLANKKSVWYQFEQLTGSGQDGDAGYIANGPVLNPLRNPLITDAAQRQTLILDPGPRTIGGNGNPATADFTLTGNVTDPAQMLPLPITTLGSAQLDAQGNLLVLAGNGASGTLDINPAGSPFQYVLQTYANNDGWFDDVSDGPVTATISMQDGTYVPVDVPAWCMGVPPKFAPEIINMVSMYDTMYDIAVRELNFAPGLFSSGAFNPNYMVDFASEIAPILARPGGYKWVANLPNFGANQHAQLPSDGPTTFPLAVVRPPSALNDTPTLMPILAGDNPISDEAISKYLSVSQTQYFLLSQWVAGKVNTTPAPPKPLAARLDQAALENCVGGAFCPGIEMTWLSRNTSIYASPFRVKMSAAITPGQLSQTNGNDGSYANGLEPGDIIKYMAQPWQADFNECSIQPVTDDPTSNSSGASSNFWWWPAQRPFAVFTALPLTTRVAWTRGFENNPNNASPTTPNLGDMQMVINWKDLAFITRSGNAFIETERNTAAIAAYTPPLKPQMIPIAATPVAAAAAIANVEPSTPMADRPLHAAQE